MWTAIGIVFSIMFFNIIDIMIGQYIAIKDICERWRKRRQANSIHAAKVAEITETEPANVDETLNEKSPKVKNMDKLDAKTHITAKSLARPIINQIGESETIVFPTSLNRFAHLTSSRPRPKWRN